MTTKERNLLNELMKAEVAAETAALEYRMAALEYRIYKAIYK